MDLGSTIVAFMVVTVIIGLMYLLFGWTTKILMGVVFGSSLTTIQATCALLLTTVFGLFFRAADIK